MGCVRTWTRATCTNPTKSSCYIPKLENSLANRAQIWYARRDSPAKRFAVVISGVLPHVRTCHVHHPPKSLCYISTTARPIVLKFGTHVGAPSANVFALANVLEHAAKTRSTFSQKTHFVWLWRRPMDLESFHRCSRVVGVVTAEKSYDASISTPAEHIVDHYQRLRGFGEGTVRWLSTWENGSGTKVCFCPLIPSGGKTCFNSRLFSYTPKSREFRNAQGRHRDGGGGAGYPSPPLAALGGYVLAFLAEMQSC